MSELPVISEEQFDEKLDEKEEHSDTTTSREAWSLLSNVDPITNLKYSWLDIREVLMSDGPSKALPMIYDYYMEEGNRLDPYTNFLLACSHFTSEELGDPVTKSAKRRLELRLRKLLKKRAKNPHESFNKFCRDNSDVLNDN